MRVNIILLIVFLISASQARAISEDLVYSGTVRDGQRITEKGYELIFRVIPEAGVFLTYNNRSTILKAGECKYENSLHMCIGGNITWAYRNLTVWKDIYQAEANIWALKADLSLTTIFDETNLYIGDQVKAEMYIQNTGSRQIENLLVKGNFPAFLALSDVRGCILSNNTLKWEGSLAPHVREGCTYTVTAQSYGSHSSVASATYFDGISTATASSEPLQIKVKNYSIQLQSIINNTKPEIGEHISANFILENTNADEKISVFSFRIVIPHSLKLLRKTADFTQSGTSLIWRGDIEAAGMMNFTLLFKAEGTGLSALDISYGFQESVYRRDFSREISINSSWKYINVNYSLSGKPDGKKHFFIELDNPSATNGFKEMDISVDSDLPFANEASSRIPEIQPGMSVTLYNSDVPSDRDYYYDLTLRYKSISGQYFSSKTRILINNGTASRSDESNEAANFSANEAVQPQSQQPMPDAQQALQKDEEKPLFRMDLGIFSMEDKTPFILIGAILFVIVSVTFIIGIIRVKSNKRQKPPVNKESVLVLAIFFIFGSFIFYSLSPTITGMAVSSPSQGLSLANGILLALIIFLFLAIMMYIYRKR